MGGRIASLLVDELAASAEVRGCLCLGYPFHPPGKPDRLRIEHLVALASPTLILQGEPDPFGTRAEVQEYGLSPAVDLHWRPAGHHSFKPTRSSGPSEAGNLGAAVEAAAQFMQRLLDPAPSRRGA